MATKINIYATKFEGSALTLIIVPLLSSDINIEPSYFTSIPVGLPHIKLVPLRKVKYPLIYVVSGKELL